MSNSPISVHNYTSETASYGQMYNDWNKSLAFLGRLCLAYSVIYTLIAVFTVLGNTLVLVATWRERSLHQPNKYFIACLAVADLLVGIFLGPMRVYKLNIDDESRHVMSIHLCRSMSWIEAFALVASIYSLTFISFDRYLKISKPLQYKSRMKTSTSVKIIFTIWLISTAVATYAATTTLSGSGGYSFSSRILCFGEEHKTIVFYTFVAVSGFFLPTVVILVMYALIFFVVHKRQKMLRNGELGETSNDQNQRTAFLQDLKVIRMLLVVVGAFMLCWGPYFIWLLLLYYHPNLIDYHSTSQRYRSRILITESLIYTLPYLNSLCNPIIYACLDQKYKQAFKNLLQRMICRRSSRRPQPDAIELRTPTTTWI